MRKKEKLQLLPAKPSELLTLALTDLEAVENNPKYEINMGTWHSYDSSADVCHVCFAGAVMAGSLNYPRVGSVSYDIPRGFYKGRSKLLALNSFREGLILEGLNKLGIKEKSLSEPFRNLIQVTEKENLKTRGWEFFNDGTTRMDEWSQESIKSRAYKKWKQNIQTLIGVLQAEGL